MASKKELIMRLHKIEQKVDLGMINMRVASGFFADALNHLCDMIEELQTPQNGDEKCQ